MDARRPIESDMHEIPVFLLQDYLPEGAEDFYILDSCPVEAGTTTLHRHDFYEFYVVIRGEFIDECNGKKTTMAPRMAHIARPQDAHRVYSAGATANGLLRNVAVSAAAFEGRLALLCTPGDGSRKRLTEYFSLKDETFADFLLKSENALLHYPARSSQFILNNLLDSILIERLALPDDTAAPPWLKKLMRDMRSPDEFTLGLEHMVELSGRSQEYLTRSMRRYYNTTPNEFIQNLRLNYAAGLLRTTTDSILSVALKAGFSTLSYFSYAFRRRFAMAPAKYREIKLY